MVRFGGSLFLLEGKGPNLGQMKMRNETWLKRTILTCAYKTLQKLICLMLVFQCFSMGWFGGMDGGQPTNHWICLWKCDDDNTKANVTLSFNFCSCWHFAMPRHIAGMTYHDKTKLSTIENYLYYLQPLLWKQCL